ncbi:MAG: glycosyltransferase family 2 protein [Flavobacteriales bacterium]|nr:glycosyltransferase family 2 protein [Flavobacteriales bacterium]
MENLKTFIVIPAYNESVEVLSRVIHSFLNFNILVVDDGSENEIEPLFMDKFKGSRVHFLRIPKNKGQGYAIEKGVEKVLEQGAEIVCTIDADGQHDVQSCIDIMRAFENENVDILLGSRFVENGSGVPFLRKIFLKGGILVNYFYSGLMLTDAHCGLRVFNRSFAEKLKFFNFRQAHASEFLYIIRKEKFRYKEFPVTVNYSPYAVKKSQPLWNSFAIMYHLLKHRLYVFLNLNIS